MDPFYHTPSSHIVCPRERYEKDKNRKVITVSRKIYHIITTSYLVDAEDEKPSNLHSLIRRNEKEEDKDSLKFCYSCLRKLIKGNPYYFSCNYCKFDYHKDCVESPSVFHSSDHPKHPLQLLWFPDLNSINETQCHSCGDTDSYSLYYCSICDFMIHPFCAKNPTPLTIDNQRRHEHTLYYFPRRSDLVCDVCGLKDKTDCLYVCLLCDFIVHKRCVYLPYVIKVSRHLHRLGFTPSLPYKEWTKCGVCNAKINENYGEYSCIKGCSYAIHSRCAMRSDVCDKKELEGEPEELSEDIKMFEEEGDGIIRHLSHKNHQMQIEKKIQRVYGETKRCQACRLPFDHVDGNVYQCMQCDYILHESCAHIPRVKQFMLHVHPLTLNWDDSRWFSCRKCHRASCGFSYECSIQGCNWVLDTLCASICEPFDHHSHPHPLFITSEESLSILCSICQSVTRQPLDCADCDFFVCFHCATLPHKTRYEHDQHFLTFFYKMNIDDEVYWCQICEKDIDPKKGLYACNECGITLHIECLLGKDPYMKPGQSYGGWIEIINVRPNTCSTRPRCINCERRCSYKIRLEVPHLGTLCSVRCFFDQT